MLGRGGVTAHHLSGVIDAAGAERRGANHTDHVTTGARAVQDAVAMCGAQPQQARDAPDELEPAADRRWGAAVYGSFLVASVVGLSYETGDDARTMTATLVASMLVFWLAHAWSEVVGHHVAAGSGFRRHRIRHIARREWPLVEAALLPTMFLALAWAGVWSRDTGATLALASAVLQITGWGFVAGLRSGGTVASAALLGAVQGMLGVALLALERLVH